MKNILKTALGIVLIPGSLFAQKVAYDARPGEVTVKGKIGNVNAPAQLWIYMGSEQWDTVNIRNGQFEYHKKTLLPAYGAVVLRHTPHRPDDPQGGSLFAGASVISVFFENGEMQINSAVDTLKNHAVVSGSAIHDQHAAYWRKEGELVREQRALAREFNRATPEQLQSPGYLHAYDQKTAALSRKKDSLVTAEIKSHPNSLVSSIAFYNYVREATDSGKVRAMLELFSPQFLQSKEGKLMSETAFAVGRPEAPAVSVEPGTTAPDFVQNDPEGRPVRLSDLKGKYVLVDFWASWCAPCRKTNPDLVKMFHKHKDANFTILGVSLDDNKEKWVEAIRKDGLNWHHVSDLNGWKNAVAGQYGIFAVPQNFLLDPSGKVILKNADLATLDKELEKLSGPGSSANKNSNHD